MTFVSQIKQIVPVIPVSDVKHAIDWYRRALDFEAQFINRGGGDDTNDSWNYALLVNDGAQIHLSKTVSSDDTLSSPCNCYVFVNNIRMLHERLRAMRADVGPLETMPWGNLECWLHDPYGNRLVWSAEESR